jgi:hypothetical protein
MAPSHHSVKEIFEKAKVLYHKAELLEKEHLNKSDEEVENRLDDIRALAGDIYNDKGN